MSLVTYAAELQFDQEVKVNHSGENLGEKQKQAVLTQSLRKISSQLTPEYKHRTS